VEVLLHMFFPIHLVYRRLCDDVVPVVKSIVLDVMAKGGNDQRKIVQVVKLGILHEILGFED
jgi:hypothetical protein